MRSFFRGRHRRELLLRPRVCRATRELKSKQSHWFQNETTGPHERRRLEVDKKIEGRAQAALDTLPALMHLVHTFTRRAPPCGCCTRIDCRFGSNLRGVRLFAWETLLPNCGPLPQSSQRLAIFFNLQNTWVLYRRFRHHTVSNLAVIRNKLYSKRISKSSSSGLETFKGAELKCATSQKFFPFRAW